MTMKYIDHSKNTHADLTNEVKKTSIEDTPRHIKERLINFHYTKFFHRFIYKQWRSRRGRGSTKCQKGTSNCSISYKAGTF